VFGIALASIGIAYADSDGNGADGSGADSGDNSMSQWHGESYAAFHRGEIGDFYTSPAELASSRAPVTPPGSALAVAPIGKWGVGHAFRDDTAA
jgi:hypothetical protein